MIAEKRVTKEIRHILERLIRIFALLLGSGRLKRIFALLLGGGRLKRINNWIAGV